MKTKFCLSLILYFVSLCVNAARIDTLSVYSDTMNRNINTVVILPEKALKGEKCPVFYMLHGHSGDERTWLLIKPELPEMADDAGIIVVCPDGENSWYWDSERNPESRFETFVSGELVSYVDGKYPTVKDRSGRVIAGLSMGGHGALWLAMRHSDVYCAAGSTSGGVDFRPFPENWNIKDQLGIMDENKDLWSRHTVMENVDKLSKANLKLIIDCGTEDFFYGVNKKFHEKLLEYKVPHDFILRPGKHDAKYWSNSIEYQWLFMKNILKSRIN